MVLPPDTRLGPYRIVSFLGAGAMGEVYRAKDTRLERDVALKVLPPGSAFDHDRLRRFEQEARATAALDHPNIVAVHDFGSQDDKPYIVSEMLDGRTLRRAMNGHPLPQRKAVDYAVQIARGLAAAHVKGIVHRDLKPENVFVTNDGHVKILDFGLAKLLQPKGALTGAGSLATNVAATEPGMVLGTVAYMSPEQVRGQAADARSDLFALGAILYEMLSGRRAFAGDTPADTISAVLSKEPPDLQTVATEPISPGVDRIVRHCLEKSPDQRFQSARDLAFDLESLSQPSEASSDPASSRWRPGLRPAIAIVAVALVVLAVLAYALVPRAAAPSITYQQLTFRDGSVPSARFAPDGRTILYTGAWEGAPIDVYSVQGGSVESRSLGLKDAQLLSVSNDGQLAVSLDSRFIGGFMFSGTLAQVPLGGAGPRQILQNVNDADWSPEGRALAVVRGEGGRSRLEFPIGTLLYSTTGWISHPRVSPDGNAVAFIDHPFQHDDGGYVSVVDRAGHARRLSSFFQTAQGLAWHNSEIWVTAAEEGNNRSLHAVGLDGRVRILATGPGLLSLFDVAKDGRALVSQNSQRLGIMAHVPGMTKEAELSWLDWSRVRGISADGTTVLFDETGQGGGSGEGVFVRSVDGSPAIRLSDGTAEDLSPDGKWALGTTVGRKQILVLPTGPGTSRELSMPGLAAIQGAKWFPDLAHILVVGNAERHGTRLYVTDLSNSRPRPISPEGVALPVAVSPDGRWVAGPMTDGRFFLYPVNGGDADARPLAGIQPSEQIVRFTPDARGVYVYEPTHTPLVITRVDIATGRRDVVKQIQTPVESQLYGWLLYLTPDLAGYAYAIRRERGVLYLVEGLK